MDNNADSLSVADILGGATATLQKVQMLYNTIIGIDNAPDLLQQIVPDVQAVIEAIHSFVAEYSSDSSRMVSNREVEFAIENCCTICSKFQDLLTLWKWHAVQKDTFWVDRWRANFFGHERVKTFKMQLILCKDILAVAMSTSRMIIKFRQQEDILKEVKDLTLKQNELVLQQEIGRAQVGRLETERTLPQISVNDSNWLSEESKQSRWELMQDIHRQQTFNESFRRVCEQALALTTFERTGTKPQDTQKTELSQLLGGLGEIEYAISPGTLAVPELDQDAHHSQCHNLTKGILDIMSPTSEFGLLDYSGYASTIGTKDTHHSQPELVQLPQTHLTPPAQSSGSQAHDKSKPICWEHGCDGRVFSSWSNLNRHKKEKMRQEPACYCPRCGAYFSRTSGRDQHLANMSCTRIRRYSNGRIRPNSLKIQDSLHTSLDVTRTPP